MDMDVIKKTNSLTSSWTSDRLKLRDSTNLNLSYPRILPQWIKFDKKV